MENLTGILHHHTAKGIGYIVADGDSTRVYVRADSFAPDFPYHKFLSAPHGIRASYKHDGEWASDVVAVGEPL